MTALTARAILLIAAIIALFSYPVEAQEVEVGRRFGDEIIINLVQEYGLENIEESKRDLIEEIPEAKEILNGPCAINIRILEEIADYLDKQIYKNGLSLLLN